MHDSRKPMRNKHRDVRMHRRDVADGLANLGFGNRVEGARRFVKIRMFGFLKQGPCDREALLLAAGNLHTAFANDCIEAFAAALQGDFGTAPYAMRIETLVVGSIWIHKEGFSRIVPEKSWVSCVTKPIWAQLFLVDIACSADARYTRCRPWSARTAQRGV
jgi:hypothetical protein